MWLGSLQQLAKVNILESSVVSARISVSETGAKKAALAFDSASGGLQDGHSGLLDTVRHGCSIPGRRLSASL